MTSHQSVILQPGQDLTYTENGEENISRVNIATYTAWTEGMFYFEDASLKDIMSSLGRWYNVNIDFEQAELYLSLIHISCPSVISICSADADIAG